MSLASASLETLFKISPHLLQLALIFLTFYNSHGQSTIYFYKTSITLLPKKHKNS